MGRVCLVVVVVGVGVATALVSFSGQEVLGARLEGRMLRVSSQAVSPSDVELRRKTRWTCTVRHARTQHDYKCTERDEKKSCRCAIQKCKHWNPGQQRHCSSSCKCKKE